MGKKKVLKLHIHFFFFYFITAGQCDLQTANGTIKILDTP